MKKLITYFLVLFCQHVVGQTPAYQWAKNLVTGANQCQGIGADNSGNVYIAGYFINTVDFDPGSGVVNLSSSGGTDFYMAKYDASGNYLWAKVLGGSTGDDIAYKILVEANGDFLICGSYVGTVDFDPNAGISNLSGLGAKDGFFAKYDNNGNLVWAKKVGGATGDEILSMDTDMNGNIYITGYFNGTADFDPGTGTQILTSSGGSNVFCAKYDASGNYSWAFNVGGSGSLGNDIALDNSSNFILGGITGGSGDFDPGAGTVTLTGQMFYAKYNSSGAYILGRAMGSNGFDKCKAVEMDDQGNLYIAGEINSTIDFDPGVSVYNVTGTYNDLYVAKYDSLGNFIYAFPILSGNSDYLFDIYVNSANGDTYISTEIGATTDLDPGPAIYNVNAFYYAVFAKYDQYGNLGWAFSIGVGSGSNEDRGFGIVEKNGQVYVCGGFGGGSADADPGSGTVFINSGSNYSSFFGKYGDCTGAPLTPGSINGSTAVCQGSANSYSIGAVAGATSYTWLMPPGWTGTSTSTSVNATAGTAGGNITVTASNGCGTSSAQTLNVTVNPTYSSSVSDSICQGDTYTFPDGTTATSATVHTSNFSTVYSCDSSIVTTLSVIPLPTVALDLSAVDTVCQNWGIINLTGESPAGGIFSGTGVTGNTFNAGVGPGTYIITYTYSDANGCTNTAIGSIYVDACTGLSNINQQLSAVQMYPNPSSGQFIISLPFGNADIKVTDLAGQKIIQTQTKQETTTLELFNSGVYIVYVTSKQGTTIRKLIVNR